MKVKTADLTRPQLNWAVAKCEGFDSFEFWHTGAVTTRQPNGIQVSHHYAEDWAQGGPIIDRENININGYLEGQHSARLDRMRTHPQRPIMSLFPHSGPTKLIAAMRCFVASRLGDEVDVPEELVS